VRYAPFLAALAVSACTLIDQRTFAPSPEEEPIPVVRSAATPASGRPALIVIDYATPAPNYRDLLRLAVRAAEARNPNVQYDVVAVTPTLEAGAPPQAIEIVRAIVAERVPSARVHLGMRADPAVKAVQVRVYVR
jgi:hypothetical protein